MSVAKDKVSILVVDDDEKKLLTLDAVLADLGQEVVCVRSGRDALRELLRRNFALILLDINMPGMDGFETAHLIRQRPTSETTPIIFITAYGDEMMAEQGYSLGAVDYILAPIVPEVLRSKVSVFVELYRRTDQIRRQSERLRQRAAQLSALANQLTEAEHRERRRLAQILHDHLQQLLVAAKMRLSMADPLAGNAKLLEQIHAVDDLINESITTSRSLTMELSPPILHDGGLQKAFDWLARKFHKDHGLTIRVHAARDDLNLPDHLLNFLYQAVRELLFNVVKHADVAEAHLSLERAADTVCITVEDRGTGFHQDAVQHRDGMDHFGLFSIRERLLYLGGSMDIETALNEGTRVTMSVPLTAVPPAEMEGVEALKGVRGSG